MQNAAIANYSYNKECLKIKATKIAIQCNDAIKNPDRATMKVLFGNVGKLYGDVGKKLTE